MDSRFLFSKKVCIFVGSLGGYGGHCCDSLSLYDTCSAVLRVKELHMRLSIVGLSMYPSNNILINKQSLFLLIISK